LALVIDVAPALRSLPLLGDPLRLARVLVNLTGNAFKFTSQGSVTVRILVAEDRPDDLLLRFEVTDTGVGISSADQSRVFNAFEQADNSATRQYGGTGLGLPISKQLARIMGGSIGVTSQPGVGSTFWFTARLDKAAPASAEPARGDTDQAEEELRRCHAGASILFAEDEPLCQEITRQLLEDAGLVVDVADDGAAALRMAAQGRYDLVLMDMQMPVMDGLEATRQIRRLAGRATVPIVALTANAFTDDRAKCLAAGMDDFLAKPLVPGRLYATLLKWLARVPA
jgi:hypothetical protein